MAWLRNVPSPAHFESAVELKVFLVDPMIAVHAGGGLGRQTRAVYRTFLVYRAYPHGEPSEPT